MNDVLLRRIMWQAHYSLKSGTNSCYLYAPFAQIDSIQDKRQREEATRQLVARMREAGQAMLLPFRVYFITGEGIAPVSNAGRGARKKVAQMKAHFTSLEQSPYKIAKPYRVCTSVWLIEGRKRFFYGTIGITLAENQKPMDNGDLVLFLTDDWREVEVFIFRGLAKPNDMANLKEAIEFVERVILEG